MKIKSIILAGLIGMIWLAGCEKENPDVVTGSDELETLGQQDGDIIPGQYIVIFKKSALKSVSLEGKTYVERKELVKQTAYSMLEAAAQDSYELGYAYSDALHGFSVKMSEPDALAVAGQNEVESVVPDRVFMMRPPWERPDPDPTPSGQQVPYGIERVGTANGTGKVAWIIDTGIDLDHPDLNVDGNRGVNFIRPTKSPDDDNGHGTHCAGIVAAKNNDIGVVGVAAGATVVPVKVLDRRGSGSYSGVIAGIDYVAANASAGDAANMSLSGGAYSPVDEAVKGAADKGIYFSLAAGNDSDNADNYSPARVNGTNIFTISAMDNNDDFASFSNYGNPPVDFCEPGVAVYSTYKEGGYRTLSGTSMAAPHMCGILLITNGNPKNGGAVSNDPDGSADPIGIL